MERHLHVLMLESALAASSLGNGLTAIRKSDFATKGRFYSGLFGVTVGLERLLKLIVILDYVLDNSTPPANDYLRKDIGHSLDRLLSKARDICNERALDIDGAHLDDPIALAAIDILTKFAKRSRYYNLDSMTGALDPNAQEPLAEWNARVGDPIIQRHHRWTQRSRGILDLGNALAAADVMKVIHTADDGSSISDMRAMALHSVTIDTKQKYYVLYLHGIISYCAELLHRLCYLHTPVLFIYEFFNLFRNQDRKFLLRKKVWDPYP